MLLFLSLVVLLTYCGSKISMNCYSKVDCSGDKIADSSGDFTSGKCTDMTIACRCMFNGGYNWEQYRSSGCKDLFKSTTGGSCQSHGAGGCKFTGCTDYLTIVLAAGIPVAVVVCCLCCVCIVVCILAIIVCFLFITGAAGFGGLAFFGRKNEGNYDYGGLN